MTARDGRFHCVATHTCISIPKMASWGSVEKAAPLQAGHRHPLATVQVDWESMAESASELLVKPAGPAVGPAAMVLLGAAACSGPHQETSAEEHDAEGASLEQHEAVGASGRLC